MTTVKINDLFLMNGGSSALIEFEFSNPTTKVYGFTDLDDGDAVISGWSEDSISIKSTLITRIRSVEDVYDRSELASSRSVTYHDRVKNIGDLSNRNGIPIEMFCRKMMDGLSPFEILNKPWIAKKQGGKYLYNYCDKELTSEQIASMEFERHSSNYNKVIKGIEEANYDPDQIVDLIYSGELSDEKLKPTQRYMYNGKAMSISEIMFAAGIDSKINIVRHSINRALSIENGVEDFKNKYKNFKDKGKKKTNEKLYPFRGGEATINEAMNIVGCAIPRTTVHSRITTLGWDLERAVTTPVGGKRFTQSPTVFSKENLLSAMNVIRTFEEKIYNLCDEMKAYPTPCYCIDSFDIKGENVLVKLSSTIDYNNKREISFPLSYLEDEKGVHKDEFSI